MPNESRAPWGDEQRSHRLLLVEDNPGDARLVREVLLESADAGTSIHHVTTLAQALAATAAGDVDVVLLDLGLPDSFGLGTLTKLASHAPDLPIVVLTGLDDEELAVRALRAKAQEFVPKSEIQGQRLARAVRQAVERKSAQAEMTALVASLRETSARTRELIAASADGVLVLARDGRVLFSNPAATSLMGPHSEQALARAIRASLDAISEGDAIEVELRPDQIVEVRIVAIEWEQMPAYLASVRDITAHTTAELALKKLNSRLQASNTKLQRLAFADPLTELLNRRGAEHMLRTEVNRCQRKRAPITACLIDCDGFKQINDAHGYAVGDRVLRAVARRLRKCLRISDHLARIGGDEFLALLPEMTFEDGLQVAARLRAAVGDEPLKIADGEIHLTVSVGVAPIPLGNATVQDLVIATESALHESKAKGKNRVSGVPVAEDGDQRILEAPPADLLRGGELRAVFHPIVRLSDERVEGYEILSRGPRGPWEMPDSFFRVCADDEHLAALDLQCLRTCLETTTRAETDGPHRYHLNLFPTTLLQTPPEDVVGLLRSGRRDARYCVEIHEQQFVHDPADLRARLRALRAAGIQIAIDDIGHGTSALELLIQTEPEIVKLDRSCVLGAGTDADRRAALRRLVGVAHALGSEPMAEGIENREDLAVLNDLGVPCGQGYLWGKPGPMAQRKQARA